LWESSRREAATASTWWLGIGEEVAALASRNSFPAAQIRTIGFLTAMIPVAIAAAVLGLISLALMSPLIVYAAFRGKHLKSPWRSPSSPLGLIERSAIVGARRGKTLPSAMAGHT